MCSSSASFNARRSAVFSASRSGLDGVEGDPGQLDLDSNRYLGRERGHELHVGGGGRAEAIGEMGRCPRGRPGPGPDAVRMASVAIGDVAADSRMEGARRDPELVGAET